MARPAWLGPPTPSTHARLSGCIRCDALVVRALDAPILGFEVSLDPVPLDVAAEISALLSGQRTYDLIRTARHHILNHRAVWDMTPDRKHIVLAQHRCPGRIPRSALKTAARKRRRKAANNRPPF